MSFTITFEKQSDNEVMYPTKAPRVTGSVGPGVFAVFVDGGFDCSLRFVYNNTKEIKVRRKNIGYEDIEYLFEFINGQWIATKQPEFTLHKVKNDLVVHADGHPYAKLEFSSPINISKITHIEATIRTGDDKK